MKLRLMIVTAMTALAAGTVPAWAGAGVSGAQILVQETGARVGALAGAYTARSGDLNSLGVNPAGLAEMTRAELTFMQYGGIEGQSTEWLAGGVPVPGLGTLAAQVLYRGQPAIDNGVDGEAPVEVKDLLFGASYATRIMPGLTAGFNAKVALLTLGSSNASALAVDLGAQYALDERTRLGAAVRQLGSGVKFKAVEDPLPLTVAVGASRALWSEGPHDLTFDLDADYQVPEKNTVVALGGEYMFKRLVALRLGYAYSAQQTVNGLTAGIGLRFKIVEVEMSLDYSLRPQMWEKSDVEMENVISLGARF